MTFSFLCATCGERHEGLPDLSFDAPFPYRQMSPEQQASFARLSSDFCAIADEDFFIRACLEIPIAGEQGLFVWGVWVSLSRPNFERYQQDFDNPAPDVPPNFGWLCNRLPGYPETLNLKTRVHFRGGNLRPRIELEPTDHPLAVHQREGITVEELQAVFEANLHPKTHD